MVSGIAIVIYLLVTVIAANLPWLSERVFFVFTPPGEKSPWLRLLEWLVLYFIAGAIGFGLEQRLTGEIYAKGWEFFVVTLCLFVVFALPGFIWRHDLRKHLRRR